MPKTVEVDEGEENVRRRLRFTRARFRRIRLRRPPKVFIPNTITALSIFAGYLSIIYALEGEFLLSAWLILLAGFLDAADGRIARSMGATSDFGEEFDSMADVINYGVGPSILFYRIYFINDGFWGVVLCFLCVFCAAARLARFNVLSSTGIDKTFFTGLPSTVGAAMLASYVIFVYELRGDFGSSHPAGAVLIIASLLMVSQVKYEKSRLYIPRHMPSLRSLLVGTLIVLSLLVQPKAALFAWIAIFVGYGVLRSALVTLQTTFYTKG